jgi:hypothetical protein
MTSFHDYLPRPNPVNKEECLVGVEKTEWETRVTKHNHFVIANPQ